MKKITLIFTVLAFVLGIAIISCTKQTTQTDPVITTATDAIVLDNTVSDFTGLVDDYTAANPSFFVDPTIPTKAASADPLPTTVKGIGLDKCATVTMVKTPTLTASAVTGATVKFTIEFASGCVGNDSKARRGTIVTTFTWVKEQGGWSRASVIDLFVSDVHYVGTQNGTFSKIAPFGHAYYTESSSMTVTEKSGSVKTLTSERQRELMEGNGGVNPVKIWKITGNSSFINAKGEKSTYTIKEPLYTSTACKGFIAGTVVTVSAGVTTTAVYGPYTNAASVKCLEGFTVTKSGVNGGPAVTTFIKFGK